MRILYELENILLRSKMAFEKKDAVDQIVIIFIIIAVAAGIAGLLNFFGTNTFLPIGLFNTNASIEEIQRVVEFV